MMAAKKTRRNEKAGPPGTQSEPVAIIGMAGRFPGARDTGEFWRNLADGIESIAVLTQEDMGAAGIPEAVSKLPGYVNAAPVLDDVDQFDAEFFGFSARDAALTDPQHRLFLETAWQALEDAGYDPSRFPGAIGVFGGCELSSYLYHLYQNLESLKYIDGMQLMVTNDKDHLCTQVSYRLNLKGPSVAVQTTCSTSLVAVALACESLQHRRCDVALAGGVTVKVPQRGGYLYMPGSILSPDGHCRPFDAQAQGTIVGSGCGLVVLKRLTEAAADRDHIRAIILGVGINNDGNEKVGYTAPSARGQAAAVRAAHRSAAVDPESIGYIEAHGTGTILGDPIELSALTEVFRETTSRRGFCGIGSVKSNFGHLSCAAGVAGLIKAVLALEHGAIPPTLHYTTPNPAIDLLSSPFYIPTRLTRWERNGISRRAGVSSFGVGGTNAHLVIEEAPSPAPQNQKRSHQVLTISARTEAALEAAGNRLSAHLRAHEELELADAAFTLHLGRKFLKFRRAVVVGSEDRRRAIEALEHSLSVVSAIPERPVIFMFPGQGSQYPFMASGLYRTEPVVKNAIDRCSRFLRPVLKADLRKLLFPSARQRVEAAEALKNTKWAQPALFTIGFALAELWISWGLAPSAMIGHSVGEYVAATLAGVLSLEDALALIARRGQLISALPRGSMLALMTTAQLAEGLLDRQLSIAAINAPGFVVLSGPESAIRRLEKRATAQKIPARRLHTSHAFHSRMMDPILEKFEQAVSGFQLRPPNKPFVSTLTGTWAGNEIVRPDYWSRQLRSPVRFAEGVSTLLMPGSPAGKGPVTIEAGPGNTLSTFAKEIAGQSGQAPLCLASLPGPEALAGGRSDTEVILSSLGAAWASGAEVDWESFHRTEQRSRVSLPTYPFERRTYWVGGNGHANRRGQEARDPCNWFYRSEWREEPLAASQGKRFAGLRFLVFGNDNSPARAIADKLRMMAGEAVIVRPAGDSAAISDHEYSLNVGDDKSYRNVMQAVCAGTEKAPLAGVVVCLESEPGTTELDRAAHECLLSPMRLAHALSRQTTIRPLPFLIVNTGTTRVLEGDPLDPPRALSVGAARVLPQEYPGLRVAHLDVDGGHHVPEMIIAELAGGASEPAVAVRDQRRFVETFQPVTISTIKPPLGLPPRPVVMITGGLGYMGMSLAEAMFAKARGKLILLGRTPLPPAHEWAKLAEKPELTESFRLLLSRLAKMRAERDEVAVVSADLNDRAQLKSAVDSAFAQFGTIDVVVHGAARIDAAAFGPVAETDERVVEAQFSPKLRGLWHLMEAMKGREPQRWVLHSSISAVLGGLSLAAYSAANAVLDALALANGSNWLSIDWDAWDNAAEAQSASLPSAIKPIEGGEVLLRLLGNWEGSRALVAINFTERLEAWVRHGQPVSATTTSTDRHPRPILTTAFVEPRNETERRLVEIWGSQLGLESVGIHDRFFDLGGHSLLAAQIASEICDRFQIELPVLKLFQAPTVSELAIVVDQASGRTSTAQPPAAASSPPPVLRGNAPEIAAKAGYREFYDNVTRRLEQSGISSASLFLNYGYVCLGNGDEARIHVPKEVFNRNSVRLVAELVGSAPLAGRRLLDVGCGRGGAVALLAEKFGVIAAGVDLSPEAIAFCRRIHPTAITFEVGDAEHLPFADASFEVATNMESSHTYPNLRAFFGEVKRVLAPAGLFLYTDLLPVARWAEVHVLLNSLGFRVHSDRDITANVLASCDEVAANRAQAFGGNSEEIDNFLAVPGSAVYDQMHSGAWQYRILRADRSAPESSPG